MPHARRSTAALAGASLLAALVVLLPLARGGVAWPAQLGAALLAPLAAWLLARPERRLPLAGLLLAGVLGVVVAQLVPWPAALHAAVPGNRAVFEGVLGPLGQYPAARPLSLDPAATARELAKEAAALAAFGGAWAAGTGRRRRSLLLGALALAGAAAVVATLAGALLGQPLLPPRFPFLNPNHLAGLLCLTSFVALGLALRSHGQARLPWLLAFVAMAGTIFMTLSRAGIAAFLGGAILFAVLGRRRDGEEEEARPRQGLRTRLVFMVGVTGALALAAFMALDPVLAEVKALRGVHEEVKLGLWGPTLTMAAEHPLLGVGRGAFVTAFPAYKTEPLDVTFTHLENEWLQPLAELGFPGGLLLVASLGGIWLAAARRGEHSWTDAGLLAGTAALAAHEMLDFSLELPGVAIPFMVALGLAARGAGPIHAGRRGVALAAAGLLACGAAGMGRWWIDRPALDEAAFARAPDADAAAEAARTAADRRPSDFWPHAAAGQRLVEADRCAEAMPWLNRAMLLNPTAAEPHLFAARCLAAAGQGRAARREYRLAWSYGLYAALPEAAGRYRSLEALLEVTPDHPNYLLSLGELLLTRSPPAAVAVYQKVLEEYGDGRALVPLAQALRAAGDLEAALTVARRRQAEAPVDPGGWLVAAQVLAAHGEERLAQEEARRGLAAAPGAPSLQGFLVERAFAAGHYAEARRLADELVTKTPEDVAARELLAARALAAQGRLLEAIDRAGAATAALPATPGPLLELATYCERAGRFDDAMAAVERAAALPGQAQGAYAGRLEALRNAKAEREVRRLLEARQR